MAKGLVYPETSERLFASSGLGGKPSSIVPEDITARHEVLGVLLPACVWL